MKQYIKNGKLYDGIAIEYNGIVINNPTESMLVKAGYIEYVEPVVEPYEPTEEELAEMEAQSKTDAFERAKANKLAEIDEYDSSSAVNGFVYNGQTLWLDKSMRAYIKNGVEAVIAKGDATYPLWNGDVCITLGCEALLQILTEIEAYAVHCYNVTAQHKANVAALETIEDIEAYDYTTGYPAMLSF